MRKRQVLYQKGQKIRKRQVLDQKRRITTREILVMPVCLYGVVWEVGSVSRLPDCFEVPFCCVLGRAPGALVVKGPFWS